MSLASPAFATGTFSRHLVSREQRKRATRRSVLVGLNLTSMVDMFSLLVIFLLQSFSASPELLIDRNVQLPISATGQELRDAPVLALSKDEVYLDQKLVGKTAALLLKPEPLMHRLAELRELWQKTHPGGKFPGEISLQAHRELPSTLVAQFMGMLPSEAYGSIQLAVLSGGAR